MTNTVMPLFAAIFLVGLIPLGFAEYQSPLDQLKGGIPIGEIECREGRMLLEKNLKPYCVGVDTAEKLEQRGWSVVKSAHANWSVIHPLPLDYEACGNYNHSGTPYVPIRPLNHTITGGELANFCVDKKYLWYVIELDNVDDAGVLSVTIPKNEFDPKQFDYRACDSTTDLYADQDVFVSVRQVSQTETDRTLEFAWVTPVSKIVYFGVHSIIEGVDYSEPNKCIKGVNSGEIREWSKPDYRKYFNDSCIEINYTITGGTVLDVCLHEGLFEEPDSFVVLLDDVSSGSVLTIDVPYTKYIPLMTAENRERFIVAIDWKSAGSLLDVVYQCTDYQTFKINLPAGAELLVVGGPIHLVDYTFSYNLKDAGLDHEYNRTIPLVELDYFCI